MQVAIQEVAVPIVFVDEKMPDVVEKGGDDRFGRRSSIPRMVTALQCM
jgi:hypothetical protein